MPTFQRALDVVQGYNFDRDKQTPVGYLHSLKIDDVELAADTTVYAPKDNETENKEAVVAVLSEITWNTSPTDSFYFGGQISISNKQNLAQLLYKSLTKMNVEFKFEIREYDPLQKIYFVSLMAVDGAVLKGLIEKQGTNLALSLSDEPSSEVQSPENYSFHIGIRPESEEQAIQLAVAVQKTVAKPWGVALAK
ncbi:MAG: hypothetical protein ACKO6N_14485 [Myxococcota bacterium]